jgi:hypothetical protein
MKKPLNRWMLFYLALVVLGSAIIALDSFVIAQQERDNLILALGMIVLGGGIVAAGLGGLLIQSIKHLLAVRKEPIQPPETTRGK